MLTLATNLGIGVLPNGGACGFDAHSVGVLTRSFCNPGFARTVVTIKEKVESQILVLGSKAV